MAILSCSVCAGEFHAHGRAKYCSAPCKTEGNARVKAEYMRRWHADYAAKNGKCQTSDWRRTSRGVDPRATLDCFLCNEPLENIRSNKARYPLHKACRAGAPLWVLQGRDKPNPRREAFQRKIDKAARGTSGSRVFTCGGCKWCGGQFVGIGVYCSKKCSTSAKFARRSSGQSFNISPRARLAIYDRDDWTCQLCNFPVERGLHYRHDWAPSLDHIIPQATTLIPDHSPSNLQLAHRMCNSMKGDGSNMTETEFHERIANHFSIAA